LFDVDPLLSADYIHAMIDAVTIVIARRRRILAVWAAVCV
jgi:hypothetical protein